jgi:hypothetical protein
MKKVRTLEKLKEIADSGKDVTDYFCKVKVSANFLMTQHLKTIKNFIKKGLYICEF